MNWSGIWFFFCTIILQYATLIYFFFHLPWELLTLEYRNAGKSRSTPGFHGLFLKLNP